MRKIFFLILLVITNNIYSQSASLNFSIAFPQGEFKEKVNNAGFGLNGDILFISPKPKTPFGIGLNLSFYIYGSESRREPLSTTIPDVTVNVDRTNNLSNFHLLFLVGFPKGRIRPYLEGLFGGSYLSTTTSVKSENTGNDFASSTNFEDYAWSYGGGFGFSYFLSGDFNSNQDLLFLDFKLRYLYGTEASYLKPGSIRIQNGNLVYDVNRSRTDLISAHLGVKYYFSWYAAE
ncbi:MAG: acyloxyacyl hydrolase [Ignavibacterium sp.]|nr:acyloxyacyl hydrolase [Ignavibacterium sp.]MCX7611379.1 acyloxyacyl hydrolase [Ignavibacterium sp.]MDW8375706.1 hypothetical protein [Ignavibacteriales bacterium]